MAASNREDFDAYRKWLGISNQKRLPTHYELLAISLDEDDPDVIQAAAEQRRHYVESKRGEGHDDLVTEILYRIDEAESTLLNTALRRDYDRKMDLFDKRRKNRQVDPVARRSGKSRGGRTVGEDGGIVKTFAGIVAIICVAFGGMAWFGFRVQPKPAKVAPVAPATPQVAQVPVAVKADEPPPQLPQLIDDIPVESLKKKLAGTKWNNSNNVSFEWTNDGRFLHSGNEREWKVLDRRRVQITYGSAHSDTLVFNDELTAFKQLIRGGPEFFDGKLINDVAAQAMKALQGEWLCIALNESGNKIEENALKSQNRRVTIDGDNFTLMRTRDGNRTGHIGKIKIGPNDTFDFVGKGPVGGSNEWPGLYEIKGDTLKLRFSNQISDGRPMDFSPGQGNLEIYVRQ